MFAASASNKPMFDVPLAALTTLYVLVFIGGITLVITIIAFARRRKFRPAPPRIRCNLCAMEFRATAELTPCPRCGSLNETA